MSGQSQGISRQELSVGLNNEIDNKVDKAAGKSLISDTEITRLAGVTNFDNSSNVSAIANKEDTANKSNIWLDFSSTIKFPTWNAIVTYVFGRVDVNVPITISANRSLSDADSGLIIIITANCTVTIASGLKSGFNCTFVTLAGVTLTLALGSGVVVFNNVGYSMSEKSSCTLNRTITSNNYLLMGAI